jgi:integrase/recombinase XerD
MKKGIPKNWVKKQNIAYYKGASKNWRSLPRSIEPDDVKRLIKKRFTPRDKCMILILLRTGMRICELLSLRPNDINLRQRMIVIPVSAKTGIGRVVYLSNDSYVALKKWMKQRDSKRMFLFYSRSKHNMSYATARSAFIKCIRKAHLIRKGYTLHRLRHTFASEMLSAGMPLESLQVLMGHSTIEVTRRYARLTNKALENDYFKSMQIIERGGINGSYRHDF